MGAAQSAIVTGANGFIGSHLVRILLQRGWTVHALGRSSKGDAWHDRVLKSLAEAGWAASPADLANLHCHEADLARPDLGFPDTLPFRPTTQRCWFTWPGTRGSCRRIRWHSGRRTSAARSMWCGRCGR